MFLFKPNRKDRFFFSVLQMRITDEEIKGWATLQKNCYVQRVVRLHGESKVLIGVPNDHSRRRSEKQVGDLTAIMVHIYFQAVFTDSVCLRTTMMNREYSIYHMHCHTVIEVLGMKLKICEK